MKTTIRSLLFVFLLAWTGVGVAPAESQESQPGFLIEGLRVQQQAKDFDAEGNFSVAGFLGVGLENPERAVHLRGRNAVFRMDRDVNTAAFLLVRTAVSGTIWKSFVVGANADGANDGSFVVNDLGASVGGGGSRRLTIDNVGNVGFNTPAPAAALEAHSTDSPFLFALVDSGGSDRLVVDTSGQLEINDFLLLRRGTESPQGYEFAQSSSLLIDISEAGPDEESWLALNGNNALLASPGDGDLGLLSLFDQDAIELNAATPPAFTFFNNELRLKGTGDKFLTATDQNPVGDILYLEAAGNETNYVSDSDGDSPAGLAAHVWLDGGFGNEDIVMELDQDGDLAIRGGLIENFGFDLAEAYWKGERTIESGDVVRVDPHAANAASLADREADRAVLGVVSTAPGVVLGGGAFSAAELQEVWGSDIASRFEARRARLETAALEKHAGLRELALTLQSFDGFLDKQLGAGASRATQKREELDKLQSDYEHKLVRLARQLERLALEEFFAESFVRIALAGRVPVKVDATYGAISPGDLLVASATPGHAMRGDDPAPGTVVGKALEGFAGGVGKIQMLVMLH